MLQRARLIIPNTLFVVFFLGAIFVVQPGFERLAIAGLGLIYSMIAIDRTARLNKEMETAVRLEFQFLEIISLIDKEDGGARLDELRESIVDRYGEAGRADSDSLIYSLFMTTIYLISLAVIVFEVINGL